MHPRQNERDPCNVQRLSFRNPNASFHLCSVKPMSPCEKLCFRDSRCAGKWSLRIGRRWFCIMVSGICYQKRRRDEREIKREQWGKKRERGEREEDRVYKRAREKETARDRQQRWEENKREQERVIVSTREKKRARWKERVIVSMRERNREKERQMERD